MNVFDSNLPFEFSKSLSVSKECAEHICKEHICKEDLEF